MTSENPSAPAVGRATPPVSGALSAVAGAAGSGLARVRRLKSIGVTSTSTEKTALATRFVRRWCADAEDMLDCLGLGGGLPAGGPRRVRRPA